MILLSNLGNRRISPRKRPSKRSSKRPSNAKPLLEHLHGLGWEVIDLDNKQHPSDALMVPGRVADQTMLQVESPGSAENKNSLLSVATRSGLQRVSRSLDGIERDLSSDGTGFA